MLYRCELPQPPSVRVPPSRGSAYFGASPLPWPHAFYLPCTHICYQMHNFGTVRVVACEVGDVVQNPAEDRIDEGGDSACVDALGHGTSHGY